MKILHTNTLKILGAKFIKCAVKPRRLGRGYKAQSFKEAFVAVEYIV